MLSTRGSVIDQDIELLIKEEFSPAARSRMLAHIARQTLVEAQERNRATLGRVPSHITYVDGQISERLEAVQPDGEIVIEFQLLTEAVQWIAEQLEQHSPVRSGRYQRSHILLADGAEVSLDAIPQGARELVFVNAVPYAREIERGLSKQAPDGVYEVVAVLAARRFGNIARIRITYRAADGDKDVAARQPAIVLTTG